MLRGRHTSATGNPCGTDTQGRAAILLDYCLTDRALQNTDCKSLRKTPPCEKDVLWGHRFKSTLSGQFM
ncbi:hypothetical protein BACSTE_01143 [Bacteroides stercoris ATCC 43183]|uniref:Uncharacterized protein n=1 Tax=Bacteroides stercoris ATCC 43183 TaxID=449673 RepID=B0NP25_BACSE|nr:hypothetical protein BACSTE_01143 [Bacteroides stercoris ATCC 43183]